MHTHQKSSNPATTIGLDIGKNTFHLIGLDKRGAIAMRMHRVRSRLVRQRSAIINQIRGFLIERGITVRQGPAPLRKALPDVLEVDPLLTFRPRRSCGAAFSHRVRSKN
jgi:hypothetical protein